MNCSAIACVAHDPSVDNSPAEPPHLQHSTHCPSGQSAHNKKPARNRCVAVPSRLVVCARWCPTLPHPGGCSTIGAVRLSFRVRDGAGRFPVAVTTETTTWAVLDRRLWCGYSVIRMAAYPYTLVVCVVGGWVGCGPYSGRFALLWLLTPAFPLTLLACVVCVGVLLFVLAY